MRNIILSSGGAVINCCGITLPPYEAEEPDEAHKITIEPIEDEYYVTLTHDMTKDHYISFIAYVSCDRIDIHKLYPEGNAETRFAIRGQGYLLYYCNRHGLMKVKVK